MTKIEYWYSDDENVRVGEYDGQRDGIGDNGTALITVKDPKGNHWYPEERNTRFPKKHKLKFREDWFERDARSKFSRYLLGEFPFKFESYLEVGVCEGASMLWVLDYLRPKKAVGIDWWRTPRPNKQKIFNEYRKNAYHNLQEPLEDGRLELIRKPSKEGLACMKSKFDLIYCDGDHSGNGAMRDWLLAYELLTKPNRKTTMEFDSRPVPTGGVLVIDDLHRSWNRHAEVRVAYCQFTLLMHGKLRLLWEDGRQAAYVRIR